MIHNLTYNDNYKQLHLKPLDTKTNHDKIYWNKMELLGWDRHNNVAKCNMVMGS